MSAGPGMSGSSPRIWEIEVSTLSRTRARNPLLSPSAPPISETRSLAGGGPRELPLGARGGSGWTMIFEINEVEIAVCPPGAFERAFAEAVPLLLAVRGCRSAALFRCIERPEVFQIRIGWDRLEDHVGHYPMTEEAAQIRA